MKSEKVRSNGVLSFHLDNKEEEINKFHYIGKCNLLDCATRTPAGSIELELSVVKKIPTTPPVSTNRLLVKLLNLKEFRKEGLPINDTMDIFFKLRANPKCQFQKSQLYDNVKDNIILTDEIVITFEGIDSVITLFILEDKSDILDNIIGKIVIPIATIEGSEKTDIYEIESENEYSCKMEIMIHKLPAESEMVGTDRSNTLNRYSTISNLKRMFYKIDKDGSGTISFEELCYAMENNEKIRELFEFAGCSGSRDDMKRLFDEIDTNNDGSIQWEEFNIYISSLLKKIDITLERCERCSTCSKKPGIRLCKECNRYFCIDCCIEHHNEDMRELRKHTFYSLTENGEYKPIIVLNNSPQSVLPHYMQQSDRSPRRVLYSTPVATPPSKRSPDSPIPVDKLDLSVRKYASQANLYKSQLLKLQQEYDHLKIQYKKKCKENKNFMTAALNVTSRKAINLKTAPREALEERITYLDKIILCLRTRLESYKEKEKESNISSETNEIISSLQKEITNLNNEIESQTSNYNDLLHKDDLLQERIKKSIKRIKELKVLLLLLLLL